MRLTSDDFNQAVDDELVVPVILFEMLTDPPVRLHSANGNISYNSNTYTGVGKFGGIDKINESQFLQPEKVTLTLAGFPVPEGSTLDDVDYKNKRVILTLMLFNKDTLRPITDTLPLFAGEADVLTISYGKEVSYSLTVSNELAAWKEGSNQIWSHETQLSMFPGDMGFEFLTDLEEKEIVW